MEVRIVRGVAAAAAAWLAAGAGAQEYRSYDGSGNNLGNPGWGAVGSRQLRLLPSDYADGVSAPAGAQRESARLISNQVCAEDGQVLSARRFSNFVMQWGQWITHDLGFKNEKHILDPFPIQVPKGDFIFDPLGSGTVILPFFRSKFDPESGTGPDNPREQVTFISSYIDANTVYGSDQTRADFLRAFEGGRLLVTETEGLGDLLPYDTVGAGMDKSPFGGVPAEGMFLAGDNRANTQTLLLAMHTVWVREHNRLAGVLASEHPEWDDETLYQESRRRVIAMNQAITYNEFLPVLLGPGHLPAYEGYRPDVNPTIGQEFAHAGFRIGHTMLNQLMRRLDESGNSINEGPLRMRDQFFQPYLIPEEGGIEPLLRGAAAQTSQEIDHRLKTDVRNFLYGEPDVRGLDLAAANIQRGRDHGLPSYNAARAGLGLAPAADFGDINPDEPTLADRLASAYATVDDVDMWVGGISEKHVPGGSVGPLFTAIIADQFVRARDGDRLWYQNEQFTPGELAEIEATTLGGVIARNTAIKNLQPNVFHLSVDWDYNLRLDIFDFLGFFGDFLNGNDRADLDGDGELTTFDFLAFQNAFYGGGG